MRRYSEHCEEINVRMPNIRHMTYLKEETLMAPISKSGLKYTYISASDIALNLIATPWDDGLTLNILNSRMNQTLFSNQQVQMENGRETD